MTVASGTQSGQARQRALEAEWGSELNAQPKVVAYKSPIKRVVSLLGKMKAELEHEAKNEAEMYDKMVCWCETNEKEKTQAISDADARDKQLSSEVESRSARFGSLGTNIEGMKKEVADLTESLKKATSIREKEAKAFAGEANGLTQALTNIKNAITILSKHQSFMQLNGPLMMGMKTVLRDLALKHELLAGTDAKRALGEARGFANSAILQRAFITLGTSEERASIRESQRLGRELLGALDTQGAGDDTIELKFAERLVSGQSEKTEKAAAEFLQIEKPPGYSSGSGPVFGMLKQMQNDFKAALGKSQEDENRDVGDFKELAGAKEAQIQASKDKLDDLEDEAGSNTKALSDAKEDLEMTRDQRSADVKFLKNLKTTCMGLDKQWAARSKTRSAETVAVSQALSIITDDDNMDMLRGSVTFLQLHNNEDQRVAAADVLRTALDGGDDLLDAWEGRHSSNSVLRSTTGTHTKLAALAVSVKLDSFTKVKEAMDKLVTELKKQQTEEVTFKAKCTKNLNGNEKATFKKTDEKEDLEASLKELANQLATLGKEIDESNKQIADTKVEMKKASQNREAENSQFQKVVADQRATQEILKKALAKLEGFYKKKALMQLEALHVSEQMPPGGGFTERKTNSGASPVIGMIEQIIEDSAQLESESMAGEKQAQAEYTKFVKDANNLISKLSKAVSEKSKSAADNKSKAADAKGDLQSAKGELSSLSQVENDLHAECDFVLKNFEVRQKARLTELEAIQSAKGILSGAR